MVLGLVGTAFAGFSDVSGNKYVDKVAAFGWVNGYPDGTFKPEGSITRAEASAVIVRALGLEAAADAAKGLGSKFSDVPATHWASGYINVCTTKSILKGYPDGTFKPEANVTNAEMITMVVRALNRESEAIGEWPIGHITVAAANSIIGSGFASNAPANRGDVATYVAKAANVQHLKLTTNGWEPDVTKTFVLMNDMELKAANKDVVINTVDTDNKSINGAFTLTDNAVIAGGIALKDLPGYTANLYTDEDGKVVLVETTAKSTSKTGQIRLVGANYFYLVDDTTKYEMATVHTVTRNGETKTLADVKADDNVEIFRDTSGKVTTLKATVFDVTHRTVISTYTTGDSATWTIKVGRADATPAYEEKTYYLATDAIVIVDGKEATLKEVKKEMLVSIRTDLASTAKYIEATSKAVSGKVTAKRVTTDVYGDQAYYVSVDGVEYRLEGNAWLKDKSQLGPANIYGSINVNDSISGGLSLRGRLAFFTETTSSSNYAKVKSFVEQAGTDTYDKWVLDVRGIETTYEVGKTGGGNSHHGTLVGKGITTDSYIELKLDGNGRIDVATGPAALVNTGKAGGEPATFGAPVQDVYSGDKLIKIDNQYFTVGDSAVVYVDGVYQTGLSGVSDTNRAWYIKHATDPKLLLMVVNSYAKLDTSKLAATANYTVSSSDGAVDGGATVEFFTDIAMTKACSVPATANGKGKLAAVTLSHAELTGAEHTVYVRVTHPFGVITTGSIKVYK